MSLHFIKKIVSGGQTGVDRAALDVAIELNIPHGGWCPKGRKAEDGVIPSQYQLRETTTADYKERTSLNVQDSDGTLIITNGPPKGGTLFTIQMAKKFRKPYFVLDISDNSKIDTVTPWLIEQKIQVLNIAGPRESQSQGIYNKAFNILKNWAALCHSSVK